MGCLMSIKTGFGRPKSALPCASAPIKIVGEEAAAVGRNSDSTHGHRGTKKIARQPRDSRLGGRWAHPPPTGGDGPTILVFSMHFFPHHPKSPFLVFLVPKTAKTRPSGQQPSLGCEFEFGEGGTRTRIRVRVRRTHCTQTRNELILGYSQP